MIKRKNVQVIVKEFIDNLVKEHGLKRAKNGENVSDIMPRMLQAIVRIVKEYGIHEYKFTLAMGFFVQTVHAYLEECLELILNKVDTSDEKTLDIYFATYYALSLVYKKSSHKNKLADLIDEKYDCFDELPLYYEVLARYYKREGELVKALGNDKKAIDKLNRKKISNAGPHISYASTVCEMLEKNNAMLEIDYVENAIIYANEAIKTNPLYQKYPFIKAKLIFLSAVYNKCELPALKKAQRQALDLIKLAKTLYNSNFDKPNFEEDYEDFKRYMAKTIKNMRFPKSTPELNKLKRNILWMRSHDSCKLTGQLPPNPNLRPDDQYFFICYSSKDFKTVYCDLIELYKRRIYFKYDRRLEGDVDWDKQVAEKINHPNCKGVVFYISENVLAGSAVQEEISIAMKSNKKRLVINLEGKSPSRILVDFAIKHKRLARTALSSNKIRLFLECADDNRVFEGKSKLYGNRGTKHFESYIEAIREKFTDNVIGDD